MSPFAPGSVSLRLYPHLDRGAPEIVEELRIQAALGVEHGFAGVMTSEHHGGFGGYVPNPLQLGGFLLDAMPRGWAAPCPLLLPLRPAALVAEEVAWLAARFPGRVGLGVAAGALPADFEVMGTGLENLTERFAAALTEVVRLLTTGDPGGPLAGDPAIAACAEHPIPVLSAASSPTAARRAARLGAGILVDSLCTPDRARALTDAYRDAGGAQACVLVRRVWLGEPFRDDIERQVAVYRGYAAAAAARNWGADELIAATEPHELGERIGDVARRAGADALNLRLHAPGIPPPVIRDQIVRLGSDVLAHDYIGAGFHNGGHPCT